MFPELHLDEDRPEHQQNSQHRLQWFLQQVINGEDLNHAIIDTGSAIVTAENIDDPEIQAVINPK